MKNFFLYIFFSIFTVSVLLAQDFPYTVAQYPFINYEANRLIKHDSLPGFQRFYKQWKQLILNGTGKIDILHLGDSHIQADFFTGRMRQRLQEFFPGSEGARGIVFPYNLAATNNPGNYRIQSPNQWEVINSVKQDDKNAGIIPARVYTTDSVITIEINQLDSLINSGFNEVELWYAAHDTLKIITPGQNTVDMLPGHGRFSIALNSLYKNARLQISGATNKKPFELYALEMKNKLPGITYHALGLNGAAAEDFVNCRHFQKFLNYTQPDLIIISLGTNDLYGKHTKIDHFTLHYGQLIQQIRHTFPDKALILTTPGDHFIYGYLPNKKIKNAREVVHSLSRRFEAAVWDFFTIMGGYKSMMQWHAYGLSAKDRVHLSKAGYKLQGDLFFNALLRDFEQATMPKVHTEKQEEKLK